MIYLVVISIFFTVVFFLNSFVNFIFRQKLVGRINKQKPLVSVLIPARNEEKNIANILTDLANQDYDNLEIIVYDDMSTDKTGEIVQNFSKIYSQFKLITGIHLPDNWIGKNFACYNLAKNAKGDFFVFLDADVRIEKSFISRVINYVIEKKLHLLTIFPTQIMLTKDEKCTVPVMHKILLTLLPLIFVRISPFSAHAAANGQFMCFNASVYRKYNLHYFFKNSRAEDIEISRFLKKHNYKIACLTGIEEIKCRMYEDYPQALEGFSKNISYMFGNSLILAFVYWLVNTMSPIIIFVYGKLPIMLIYLVLLFSINFFVSVISRQNFLENLWFSLCQHKFMLKVILNAIKNFKKRQFIWKGRILKI